MTYNNENAMMETQKGFIMPAMTETDFSGVGRRAASMTIM